MWAAAFALVGLPPPMDSRPARCCMVRTQANKQNLLYLGILDPYRGVAGVPTLDFKYTC